MNVYRRDYCKTLVVCAALLSFPGCTSLALNKLAKLPLPKAKQPPAQATRMLCLWQPAEGVGLDGLPCRGIAGQVFFFDRHSDKPIVVDGSVRIYLFDDQGTLEEQAKPLHQFDFIDSGWQSQLYETQLGSTYQVFIPYVRKGNHEAECAVRVRLVPQDGPTVYSDMAYVTLPGVKPETKDKSSQQPGHASTVTDKTEMEKTVAERLQKLRAATFAKRGKSNAWEVSDSAATEQPQTPANASTTVTDERLERIETALAQLLEERQSSPQTVSPAAGQPVASKPATSEAAADEPPVKRFRMKAAQ